MLPNSVAVDEFQEYLSIVDPKVKAPNTSMNGETEEDDDPGDYHPTGVHHDPNNLKDPYLDALRKVIDKVTPHSSPN